MTAINLATTAISGFSKKEATQAIIIALLFLALLYQAPAALLLYWTTNNLIHFLRALYKRLQARKYANALKTHNFTEKLISTVTYKVNHLSSQTKLCSVLLILLAVFKLTASITHKNGWTIATYLTATLLLCVLAKSVVDSLIKDRNTKSLSKVIKLISLVFSAFTVLKIAAFTVLDATKHHLGQYALISAVLLLISSNTEKLIQGIKLFAWKYLSKEQRAINAGWTKLGIGSVAIAYVSCFVIVPMRFYVQNMTELWFTGSSLAAYVAIAAIAVFLFLYYVVSRVVIPKKISIFLLMLSTCVVFQNFLWPQQVKEFIGYDFDWLRSPLSYVNLAIWLAILTVGFYVCFKKKVFRQAVLMFDFLIMITVSATTWQQRLDIGEYDSSRDTLSFDKTGMFDLGKKENIIIFLLDTVSEESMEELYRTDKTEIEDIFKGFTWYQNNVGSGPVTSYALPYIFTNVFMEKGENYLDYLNRAFSQQNVIATAKKYGYKVRIYSDGNLFSGTIADQIENAVTNKDWGIYRINNNAINNLLKIENYNVTPDLFKQKRINVNLTENQSNENSDDKYIAFDDPWFYYWFATHGFKVKENLKNFIFYHLRGSHPPYRTDINGKWVGIGHPDVTEREQLLGCVRQVGNIIKKLKQINKFNDSTVVIMSDHGKHKLVKTSFPILFFKNKHTNEEKLIIDSTTSVGHKNLLDSIIRNDSVETKDRLVMDYDFNVWKAPDNVDLLKEENFKKQKKNVKSNLLNKAKYELEGFEEQGAFGTYMHQNAKITFKDSAEEIIKLCFYHHSEYCNGFIDINNGLNNKKYYVGNNGIILLKKYGNEVTLNAECKLDNFNINSSVYLLKPQSGETVKSISENSVKKEYYYPEVNKEIIPDGKQKSNLLFKAGFSYFQNDGVWNDGNKLVIEFLNVDNIKKIKLFIRPMIGPKQLNQQINILNDNEDLIYSNKFNSDSMIELDLKNFQTSFEDINIYRIIMEMPNALTPAQAGLSGGDTRKLGFFIKKIIFE